MPRCRQASATLPRSLASSSTLGRCRATLLAASRADAFFAVDDRPVGVFLLPKNGTVRRLSGHIGCRRKAIVSPLSKAEVTLSPMMRMRESCRGMGEHERARVAADRGPGAGG